MHSASPPIRISPRRGSSNMWGDLNRQLQSYMCRLHGFQSRQGPPYSIARPVRAKPKPARELPGGRPWNVGDLDWNRFLIPVASKAQVVGGGESPDVGAKPGREGYGRSCSPLASSLWLPLAIITSLIQGMEPAASAAVIPSGVSPARNLRQRVAAAGRTIAA